MSEMVEDGNDSDGLQTLNWEMELGWVSIIWKRILSLWDTMKEATQQVSCYFRVRRACVIHFICLALIFHTLSALYYRGSVT